MAVKDKISLTQYKEFIKQYREYDKRIGSHNEIKELAQKIANFMHDNIRELASEVLYDRYEKNLKKPDSTNNTSQTKRSKKVSFLSTVDDIKNDLIEPIFSIKLKNRIISEIESAIAEIPMFETENFTQNELNSFYIEIITDPYTYSRYRAYFYYDKWDESIIEGYLNLIYRDILIPFLREKYNVPEIFKTVNTEKFAICSPDDFNPDMCSGNIARKNITNLINKLIEQITIGAKLLEQDEIFYIYQLKLILDMTKVGLPKKQKEEEQNIFKTTETSTPEDQLTEQIKEKFKTLLKGSVKASNEYIGFFRKEDYISFLYQKYKDVGYNRLEEIFDSVVNPKPPLGVIKFVVPSKETDEKFYYFISMEEVPVVFTYMTSQKKEIQHESYANIKRHHFFMFLKKMFKDLKAVNYDDERMAKYFGTDVRKIIEMRTYVEKLD